MEAALYLRYSSKLQKATSLEDQEALCRREAARFSCTVDEAHIYRDAEVSGASTDRPGYQALMRAAKTRKFAAIITEGQDRLWRNEAEMHKAIEILAFHGVKVFDTQTGADLTDRKGRVLASVVGIKDAAFREDLKAKTRRGMAGQVSRGFSAGGAPYGYRSEPAYDGTKDAYGRLVARGYHKVIDPTDAKVVRRIFEMCASGLSHKAITYRLNAQRVPPPRPKKGRIANGWTWTTLRGILINPIYTGKVIWNRSEKATNPETGKRVNRPRPREAWQTREDSSLRIVSDALWKRVQARRQQTRKQTGGGHGGPRPRHLFSGLVRCGTCGARYTVRDGDWYVCSFHKNRGPDVCPNGKLIRRTVLEERLLAAITEEILTPANVALLTQKVNAALRRQALQSGSERKAREAKLGEVEAEVENIKAAIRKGKATDTLLEMLEEATAKMGRLRAEAKAEPKARAALQVLPTAIERYVRDLRATLGRDTDRARSMLAGLLGEVVLRPRKDGLWAEIRGDPWVLLEDVPASGAGRGI